MPRFFFHLRDDLDVEDFEGAELPSLDAARERATKEARQLMCDTLKEGGRITLRHRIDIEDEEGAVLETVRFAEAVRIES